MLSGGVPSGRFVLLNMVRRTLIFPACHLPDECLIVILACCIFQAARGFGRAEVLILPAH